MNRIRDRPHILHVMEHEKFIPAFIKLITDHLDTRRHHFFFVHNGYKYNIQGNEIVTINSDLQIKKPLNILKAIFELNQADKIILHGLFNSELIFLLFIQPWLLHKCYWIIWGGDLYAYSIKDGNWRWRIKEWFRRPIIRNFGHLVTYIPGDVELARKWYGAKGLWHDSLMYPSNTFSQVNCVENPDANVNILLGNSADPGNNHVELLNKLIGHKDYNIKIFCPLSYGDANYAEKISNIGSQLFGDKFIPLRGFLEINDYLLLLSKIDIAFFAHNRQQGMGNIIKLLGMGKKVYLRHDITPFRFMKKMGIDVYDLNNFNLEKISDTVANRNSRIVRENFSELRLISSIRRIYE